ncbi:MAG: hypothetical protein WBH44_00230 [Proteocatella sp.]
MEIDRVKKCGLMQIYLPYGANVFALKTKKRYFDTKNRENVSQNYQQKKYKSSERLYIKAL